jgi:hypothetical protein
VGTAVEPQELHHDFLNPCRSTPFLVVGAVAPDALDERLVDPSAAKASFLQDRVPLNLERFETVHSGFRG